MSPSLPYMPNNGCRVRSKIIEQISGVRAQGQKVSFTVDTGLGCFHHFLL